jgi:dTDP-4-dehydrorhamnose 3,5-epimerase
MQAPIRALYDIPRCCILSPMTKITELDIPGVLLIELPVFHDERGWFQEFWNPERTPIEAIPNVFVQDNLASSQHRVTRGLHYQDPFAQGKLITVVHGEIFDVAVDIRRESPTFGRFASTTLAAGSGRALYIPPGFAHGYQVLSNAAAVAYKCSEYFHPESEHTILWDDPEIGIPWPLEDAIVSAKDKAGASLRDVASRT